ncbi:MAG TPA: hypothetical protein VHN11_22610, partial [Xanthobacteraceae bacterium]|nr:hypothetical protein [Xanthobacteraceae bacterium]
MQRASGIPCSLIVEGDNELQNLGQNVPREGGRVSAAGDSIRKMNSVVPDKRATRAPILDLYGGDATESAGGFVEALRLRSGRPGLWVPARRPGR